MRGLIIGLPLSALLWWAIFEYGVEAIGLVVVILSVFFLVKNLREDWVHIKSDEPWADGETTGYGRDK
jgi:hypothetical protein